LKLNILNQYLKRSCPSYNLESPEKYHKPDVLQSIGDLYFILYNKISYGI